jgi:PAS domain S-box-containing protein
VDPSEPGQERSLRATEEAARAAEQRAERILILAPTGTDAQVISAAATEGGFTPEIVDDMASLCTAIAEGAGAVVLVDEALSPVDVAVLREMLRAQPSWSDLPILPVLSAEVDREEALQRMRRLVQSLQPVVSLHLLERPLEGWILVTRFTAAIRARRRQYASRARMEQADLDRRRELALLASLPVGVLVFDAAGRLIESNAAIHRIWGALPAVAEDIRLFRARRTGSELESTPFQWRISRVLATGQPMIEEELEIETFDGVRRTIISSALPIRDSRGKLGGVVAVQVDITEIARAHRARQILSEASAALIESLDPGVTLRTLSRIVVTHLADCCAIDEMDERGELRRLVAETTGAPTADEAARLLAFVPAASGNSLAARVLRSQKPLLVSEVPTDWLARGLEADEHRAAFAKIGAYSLMVLPLIARGRPLGVLGIVSTRADRRYDERDLVLAEEISRRASLALDNAHLHRQAEAALLARNAALAEVIAFHNAAPVGFAVLDRDLRYRHINPVLARFHDQSPDEIVGHALEELVTSEFEAQLAPKVRTVLRTGQTLFNQLIVGEIPPGSGKRFYHLDSFMPVLDADGTTRAVGIIVTDITPLKEAEKALREEGVLRERFVGVLAHDLRSPLHAVVLSAGALLRAGDAPPLWVRSVGRIAHAAGRMERMIGNLLDLVRSREGGGISVDRKPTDLAGVVREVAGELEASHPGRNVAISVAGNTCGELDADRMAEVVSNLAGNALAYSPVESTVEVDVRGRDGELELAVHNVGAPIPPERQKAIFMPFQRGAEPTGGPPVLRGLGLGLFIVGEITRAHGGSIAVSSTAEAGTTFTVRLPRERRSGFEGTSQV